MVARKNMNKIKGNYNNKMETIRGIGGKGLSWKAICKGSAVANKEREIVGVLWFKLVVRKLKGCKKRSSSYL